MSDRPSIDHWQAKLNRYLELADQFSEAKAELSNMDNIKQTVFAMAGKASGESTAAAQQREAFASEAYQQWTRDHYAAVKQCENLRLRMRAAELWFEMVRTLESTRREEMRLAR